MLRRSKYKLVIANCQIKKKRMVLPNNIEDLWIIMGNNIRSSLNKTTLLEKANELRRCHIINCEKIECVVELDSSSSSLSCLVLNKLELLELKILHRLCELVRVEGVVIPPHIFSNLKQLDMWHCSRMRKLLPLELL
ncbi:hypothetical protein SLA2020_004370 [Shorea laevis]